MTSQNQMNSVTGTARPSTARPSTARPSAAGLLLAVLILLSTALPPILADSSPDLVILRPRVHEITIGETEVVFLVAGIEDAQIETAVVYVDSKAVATVREPPWRAKVDSGDRAGSKVFRVAVHLVDGRTLNATLTTKPAGLSVVDVRLVNLAVTVVDNRGRPVRNLRQKDFQVFDQGNLVAIERWDDEPATLAVALVIDASLTMEGRKLEAAKDAARSFVESLEKRDLVTVVSFNESTVVKTELTADHSAAIKSIRGLTPRGGTALYDAVYDAAQHLSSAPHAARKIAVILSDGRDESASGLEPGSFHTLEESIRRGHKSDIILFTIGLGSGLEEQPDYTGRMTTAEVLRRMASSTGGRFFRVRRFSKLARTYREILAELRNQYHIAFPPPKVRPGESWRSIRVEVGDPEVDVRTREGYYVR